MRRITNHAIRQLNRLSIFGLDSLSLRKTLWRIATRGPQTGSMAVLIGVCPFVGNDSVPFHKRTESNGNRIWGVFRDGVCTTVFFRRCNQPPVAERLRVDLIVIDCGWIKETEQ